MAWPRESRLTTISTTSPIRRLRTIFATFLKSGCSLADAVISKVLFLDDLVTDNQLFGVALCEGSFDVQRETFGWYKFAAVNLQLFSVRAKANL